jgi:hypothetical protein
MTQSEAPQVRANRDGDPCPGFCTTTHGELLVPDAPQYGYMDDHWSVALIEDAPVLVRLTLSTAAGAKPVVALGSRYHRAHLFLGLPQADALAALLGDMLGDGRMLADQVRTAVAIARETA